MYTYIDLEKYDFFKNELEKTKLIHLLDSLTGVLSRKYITDFINDLVDKKIEFTVSIIDLDNFKTINDEYGHIVGDEVLINIANNLIAYLGDKGLVGRYGGDEFIMVTIMNYDYNQIHDFYEHLYKGIAQVFRKKIKLAECNPFITATIGSASYPHDGNSYTELLELIDKTLYRGKTKGRNCYVIYVHDKHKNLVVKKIARHSICALIQEVTKIFDDQGDLIEKLNKSFTYIGKSINIYNAFYINEKNELYGLIRGKKIAQLDNINIHLDDGFKSILQLDEINKYKILKMSLETLYIESMLITDISKASNHGYLMFADKRLDRLWQEEEKALLFYMSRLVAENLETKKA